jgi:prepilin-type N-terminal cleavage/methylation domain-containing protein
MKKRINKGIDLFLEKKKTKKGFSLIEVVIYLAIFTMVSALVFHSFITVMSAFSTTRTNRNLLEAGLSSMERISREIRQAKNIDLMASNLTIGILQLDSVDNNDNLRIIKFSKENSELNFYQTETLIGNLIGSNISLESLIFRKIETTKSQAIKIEMTLRDLKGKNNKTANFYNTIILRGGY